MRLIRYLFTESDKPTYAIKDVIVELCTMAVMAPTGVLLIGMLVGYALALLG